ncbi:MAG: IS3 family transposase [Mucilaginibacter sp.]|jgi:transposase InsO family protein|uniref:IS3 family transposase n=1 Tax=Mucilaginibacter sp. TaxID=1882438 RepID=UPI0035678D61
MKVEQSRGYSLALLCSLSGYSRQAYYKRRLTLEKEPLKEELIIQLVLDLRELQPRIGGRKLLLLLSPFMKRHRISMGRDTFFTMLGHYELLNKRGRKKPRTTDSGHWMRKYPNLVTELIPTASDELWVSDITYLMLKEKDVFLSLVTDAFSRKIVGFHVSDSLSADGAVLALQMAIGGRRNLQGLIHHSDRGCQYCCDRYVNELKGCGISISMTQSGDPRDNAIAEPVNGILKMELLQPVFADLGAAITAVTQAVNIYNYLRPHSSISMLTPALVHGRDIKVKRCWKNYYRTIKQNKPDVIIHKKEPLFKRKKSSKKKKTS